jgi:hypothetical protein
MAGKFFLCKCAVMNLRTFIEQADLNWSEMYVQSDSSTGYHCPFPISPDEFITFAKADVFSADARGYINALTNAKRAIDSQVDGLITSIGLKPDRLDKQLGSAGVAFLNSAVTQSGVPLKFRLLEVLGVATPAIVAKMRQLRNALEHQYRKPKRNEVRDAIDVAELFVQACGGRMRSSPESFSFGSGVTEHRGFREVAKDFMVHFKDEPEPQFSIQYWDRETLPIRKTDHGIVSLSPTSPSPELKLQPKDEGFIPLMKFLWSTEFNVRDLQAPLAAFLSAVGIKFPKSRLRVRGRL